MNQQKRQSILGLNLILFGLYVLPRIDFQADSILKWSINIFVIVYLVLLFALGYTILKHRGEKK